MSMNRHRVVLLKLQDSLGHQRSTSSSDYPWSLPTVLHPSGLVPLTSRISMVEHGIMTAIAKDIIVASI